MLGWVGWLEHQAIPDHPFVVNALLLTAASARSTILFRSDVSFVGFIDEVEVTPADVRSAHSLADIWTVTAALSAQMALSELLVKRSQANACTDIWEADESSTLTTDPGNTLQKGFRGPVDLLCFSGWNIALYLLENWCLSRLDQTYLTCAIAAMEL